MYEPNADWPQGFSPPPPGGPADRWIDEGQGTQGDKRRRDGKGMMNFCLGRLE